MSYLLDTDWLADFLGARSPAVELVRGLVPDGIAISVITYMEIQEGIRGGRDREEAEAGFRDLLTGLTLLDVDETVADQAATIRYVLRVQRKQVNHRALDLLIAATALEYDLTLVTRNVRHYLDIPGLRLHGGSA